MVVYKRILMHDSENRPDGASTLPPPSATNTERCDCCPYGYHIDLDFLKFCDNITSGANLAKIRSFRRSRTRTRRTQTPSPSGRIPPSIPVRSSSLPGIGRSRLYSSSDSESDIYPATDDETFALAYSHFANQLQKFSSDGNFACEPPRAFREVFDPDVDVSSDTQSLPAFPGDVGLCDVDSDYGRYPRKQSLPIVPSVPSYFSSSSSNPPGSSTTTISPLSLTLSHTHSGSASSLSSSSSSQFSPIHTIQSINGVTSQQIASNLGSFLHPSRYSPAPSGSSTPSSSQSQSTLSHIRDQMALSLQRLRELEEQVKAIPVLHVKINVLKEEKRLLTMQVKSRKNRQQKTIDDLYNVNNEQSSMSKVAKAINCQSKVASTQADIILSDLKKDYESVGVQVNINANANNTSDVLTTKQSVVSTTVKSMREIQTQHKAQFVAPAIAKVMCDTGVGFINVNKVECDKCRNKNTQSIGIGDGDIREEIKPKQRNVGSSTVDKVKRHSTVGTNTKPKVTRDKAIEVKISNVTQATNTTPPLRKDKSTMVVIATMDEHAVNTDLTHKDITEKKCTNDMWTNTDRISQHVKAVNTEVASKRLDYRQIRKPPRPVRHTAMNTIEISKPDKLFNDCGVGTGTVNNYVNTGINPLVVLTCAKATNTTPCIYQSVATITERNTKDVGANTLPKLPGKSKGVSANIKNMNDKHTETDWIRISIATNTPCRVTKDTGTHQDIAMTTNILSNDVMTNWKDIQERGQKTDFKEYFNVGVTEKSLDTVRDFKSVAVGESKTTDVCDKCATKKNRTIAVGVCSIKDSICDRCTNMKSRTIGVGNCTVSDSLCMSCIQTKSTRTIGAGSCSVHDILCYKCAMMNCVNKAVGDQQITDAICNVCKKPPQRHIGVGIGAVNDVLCDKCQVFNFVNQAVGDCTITDRLCDRCDTLKMADAAVDCAVFMDQYRSVAVGDGNVTFNDASVSTDVITMANVAMETDQTVKVNTAVGDNNVKNDAIETRPVSMVTTASGLEEVALRNVGSGTVPVIHISSGVGSGNVRTSTVGVGSEKLQTNSVNTATEKINVIHASVDAFKIPVKNQTTETNQIKTTSTGVGNNTVLSSASTCTDAIAVMTSATETEKVKTVSVGVGKSHVYLSTGMSTDITPVKNTGMVTDHVKTVSTGVGEKFVSLLSVGMTTDKVALKSSSTETDCIKTTNTGVGERSVFMLTTGTLTDVVEKRTLATETNCVQTADIGIGEKTAMTSVGMETDQIAVRTLSTETERINLINTGVGGKSVDMKTTSTITDAVHTVSVGVGLEETLSKNNASSSTAQTVETSADNVNSISTSKQNVVTQIPQNITNNIATHQKVAVGTVQMPSPRKVPHLTMQPLTAGALMENRNVTMVTENVIKTTDVRSTASSHQNVVISGNGVNSERKQSDYESIEGYNDHNGFENRHALLDSSPSQQELLKTCIKRNSKKEVKPSKIRKEIAFVGVNGNLADDESTSSSSSSDSDSDTSDTSESSDSDTSQEGSYDGRLGKVVKVCETEGKVASVSELAAHGREEPVTTIGVTKDKKNTPNIEEIEESFEFNEEISKSLAVLEKHSEKPGDTDTKELAVCMSIIASDWFRVSSQKDVDEKMVLDYLKGLQEMSKGILEKVVNLADGNGNTCLHYCVSHGNFSIVSILLDTRVCDTNKQNRAGYTPIMLASLAILKDDQQKEVIQQLFQMGDVNIRATQAGQTALMLAVSHGRLDMVRLLLLAGANVNMQDEVN
uniref:KN motif and ankyrin repeat domain-containing protein 1-like n=1 Tax=Saccoglossus kowalevskii TaxID=10224 RepID=A0ABM0LZB0_SACKO|nr:PREDICTED: KN motif and ankyrin repeat domain-containing protein 1-like [Saccoglossus kowalevskii]